MNTIHIKVLIYMLVLSDIFYLYGFKIIISGILDNLLTLFSVVLIITIVVKDNLISYLKNIHNKLDLKYIFLITFIYSIFVATNFNSSSKGTIATYFSHYEAFPALLMPISILIGKKYWQSLNKLNDTLIINLLISFVAYSLYIILFETKAIQHFRSHVGILILVNIFIDNKGYKKFLINLTAILFLVIHIYYENRTLALLLIFVLIVSNIKKDNLFKYSKYLVMSGVLLVAIFFNDDIENYYRYYILSNQGQEVSNIGEILESRTFVYIDFFNDMNTNELIFGRGVLGYTFSEYFVTHPGDQIRRFAVEPGILNVILKGGIILLVIYTYVSIIAIKNKFFDKRTYVIIILLLLQFLFTIYNMTFITFVYWFLIGSMYNKNVFMFKNKWKIVRN